MNLSSILLASLLVTTLMIVLYSVRDVEKISGNSNRGPLCCSSWRLLEYHRFFRVRLAGFYEDFCYAPLLRRTEGFAVHDSFSNWTLCCLLRNLPRERLIYHRSDTFVKAFLYIVLFVCSSVLYGKLESISPKRRGAVAKC